MKYRKKLLILSFLFFCCFPLFSPFVPYVTASDDISVDFTDPNFKQAVWEWLGNPMGSTPGAFTKQDLIERIPSLREDEVQLQIQGRNISSLDGFEYFEGTGIKSLSCFSNQLSSLPPLPSSLIYLNVSHNQLSSLPALPSGLETLECQNNMLTVIPDLPNTLQSLTCGNNNISKLPNLPSGLKSLHCSDAELIELPTLPVGLEYLNVSTNKLTYFPNIPSGLNNFNCYFTDNWIDLWSEPTKSQTQHLTYKYSRLPQYRINTSLSNLSLSPGETQQINVQKEYWGRDAINWVYHSQIDNIVYSSSDNGVATVTAEGVIEGVSAGNCNINVNVKGMFSNNLTHITIPVIVNKAPVLGLNITPNPISLNIGDTQQVMATLKYTGDTTEDVTNSTDWNISSNIAIITDVGLIKAVAAGECTLEGIYSHWNGTELTSYSNTAHVTVTEPVEPINPPSNGDGGNGGDNSPPEETPPVDPKQPIDTDPVEPITPEQPNPPHEEPKVTPPSNNNGSGGGSSEDKPTPNPVESDITTGDKNPEPKTKEKPITDIKELKLYKNIFIARLDKAKNITDALTVSEIKDNKININPEIKLEDGEKLRAYFWNETKEKWIALASYATENTVEFKGDIKEGYVAVFAVNEPEFVDLNSKNSIEPVINKLNGLAIIEGKPYSGLKRIFAGDEIISTPEFAGMTARLLGQVLPGQNKMYTILPDYQNQGKEWYGPHFEALKTLGITIPEDENISGKEISEIVQKIISIIEAQTGERFSGELPKLNNSATRAEAAGLILEVIEGLGW